MFFAHMRTALVTIRYLLFTFSVTLL